jgi:hypothetical protein
MAVLPLDSQFQPEARDAKKRHIHPLKCCETMLENTPSEFDNRPLSNGPLFQWLGVQWQGSNYAISLNSIAAVFKDAQISPSNTPHDQLDVAVHDGNAIFMKAFSDCFAIPQKHPSQASSKLSQWVIVLNPPMSSATGCRVQSVVGPFWAKAGLAYLDHDGQSWTVVYRSGEMSVDMPRDMSGEAHA